MFNEIKTYKIQKNIMKIVYLIVKNTFNLGTFYWKLEGWTTHPPQKFTHHYLPDKRLIFSTLQRNGHFFRHSNFQNLFKTLIKKRYKATNF